MYWLNYLDRNAIALAKLSTLDKDLGLNGTQYNTCVSILFVGYILFGVPANMLLTRIRPSLFLCCIMMCWAVVSLATAFAKNFTGLLLTRFFLGVLEAPYYPGALVRSHTPQKRAFHANCSICESAHPFQLLHQDGSGSSHSRVVHGQYPRHSSRRSDRSGHFRAFRTQRNCWLGEPTVNTAQYYC